MDALHPHTAGDNLLWKLHQFNNIDKHRRLSLVACSVSTIALRFTNFTATARIAVPPGLCDG